jgi:hypothetical protein
MNEAKSIDGKAGPRAWVIFADNGNCRMWTTFQPHIQATADAAGLQVTLLYDQAAIDAAVAAERERWADAMRAVMYSPAGTQQRYKLEAGQGTNTPGGRAWLSALRMLESGPNIK